jgi:hypothetical protein
MRGPANPSQNYEWGMLVEGFHTPPTFMMTYNKPYYGKLVEGYGFEKSQDMYAFLGHVDMLKDLDPKLTFIAEEARKRFKVDVRPISKKNFKQDVDSFLEIYNKALPGQLTANCFRLASCGSCWDEKRSRRSGSSVLM